MTTTPDKECLFSFNIEGRDGQYTVFKSPLRGGRGIQIVTEDPNRNTIAWIQGNEVLDCGKVIFQPSWIQNPQRSADKTSHKPAYVPHGVGKTIVELVTRGYIDLWKSSVAPWKPGLDMYREYLANVPTIRLTTQNNISFEITKR